MSRPIFVIGTLHLPSLPFSRWDWQCCSLKWIQVHVGNNDNGEKNYNPLRISLYFFAPSSPLLHHTRLLLKISQLSSVAAESQLHFISGWEEGGTSRDLRVHSSHIHLVCHLEECNLQSSTGQLFMNMNWPIGQWSGGIFCWKSVISNLRHSWTLQYPLLLTSKKQTPLTFPKRSFISLHRKCPVIPFSLVNRLVLSMQEIELESH